MKLEDDHYCFACGRENPEGLHLVFEGGGRGVMAFFTPERRHQGYKGIVHGGIISAILDEAMAHAAIKAGQMPVTAEISVRFRNALPVGQKVRVEGWIEGDPDDLEKSRARRLLEAASELKTYPGGGLVAAARAKLMQP
ncbi:MAG: PaaI family thioesterase [Nitrospiraceae bacterium]|nr:PaaI family thioesterase [Nitrospiraceae bacterium]